MNPYLHHSVRHACVILEDTLSRIGQGGGVWALDPQTENAYRSLITQIAPAAGRQQQLNMLMEEIWTMRMRLAVHYTRALPRLITSGSVFAVLPMARAALEANALLNWHTAAGLSVQEHFLRILVDAHRTFEPVSRKAQGQFPPTSDIHQQARRLLNASSAEIAAVGRLVKDEFGERRRKASLKMPKEGRAADCAVAQMARWAIPEHRDPSFPPFMYGMLSDAVHSNALALSELSSKSNRATELSYTDFIDIANIMVPVNTAVGVLAKAFADAWDHWAYVDVPLVELNDYLIVAVDLIMKHGDKDIFVGIDDQQERSRRSASKGLTEQLIAQAAVHLSPHAHLL
ncbi:MAG: hypothetical protein F4190_02130 [Acidimicrobiales bacterium]|nr:hypothetical protein [Acidimicrobiales bacterium]MYI28052.1 hypothetical protein [Acidimicrobiales bacterium]